MFDRTLLGSTYHGQYVSVSLQTHAGHLLEFIVHSEKIWMLYHDSINNFLLAVEVKT